LILNLKKKTPILFCSQGNHIKQPIPEKVVWASPKKENMIEFGRRVDYIWGKSGHQRTLELKWSLAFS
jgi:hypothetical protein